MDRVRSILARVCCRTCYGLRRPGGEHRRSLMTSARMQGLNAPISTTIRPWSFAPSHHPRLAVARRAHLTILGILYCKFWRYLSVCLLTHLPHSRTPKLHIVWNGIIDYAAFSCTQWRAHVLRRGDHSRPHLGEDSSSSSSLEEGERGAERLECFVERRCACMAVFIFGDRLMYSNGIGLMYSMYVRFTSMRRKKLISSMVKCSHCISGSEPALDTRRGAG